MNFTPYELHRRTTKSGAFTRECEYEVKGEDGETLYTGVTSGRLLTSPAVFRDASNSPLFKIQANRKIAPKEWTLLGANDEPLALLKVSYSKRGATEITLSTGEVYWYKQTDSIKSDYLKAAILLDNNAFVLMNQNKIIADSNAVVDPQHDGKSLLGRLAQIPADIASSVVSISRKEFYRSESIRVYDGWTPEFPFFPAVIMVFKDEVIEQIRSA